ncbi:MAG: ATP-binding cassette domain-containing protein [Rhodospirillales bacterium]|jgi:ATP-binding cassette subfamily C protein LapB|nr:ATP-binding cassette domain-containing protein [Rhodospirillales bacterium]|tara:strand:- start:261 stop:1970 length:1710 start_codon:yes stop_codon:yes gene_type:complete
MRELYSRLFSRPAIAVELITATFFVSILALASPLFVMQVLNRYVAQGVDATLFTLTSGVLIAIVLELAFREARMHLAQRLSSKADEKMTNSGYNVLTRAKLDALERVPPDMRREILNGTSAIEQAYSATNITAVLDVPFALLFVIILYLIEPLIAFIVAGFLIVVFLGGLLGAASTQSKTNELTNYSGHTSALLGTAIRESETVRAFNAVRLLQKDWASNSQLVHGLRRQLNARQGFIQSLTQSSNALLSVAVIVTAGILVVQGEMDVGAMIGTNIMAARALQPISRFSQLGGSFTKAKQAISLLNEFSKLPLERDRGSALTEYSGGLEFRDLGFNYHGDANPIFESVSLKVEPGSVLVVTGSNGAGKTTLAKVILGLYDPVRGHLYADGLDIQQMASEWWRQQIVYLPQEPALVNASIYENIIINCPDADPEQVNRIVDATGLRRFVDESENGLETLIVDNGWRLSEGIRRRLALARGLLTNGRLVLFDEPTESFDTGGVQTVHAILSQFAQDGRTIIVMSHDPNIVKGRHTVLDLDQKPIPAVTNVPGVVANAPPPEDAGDRQAGQG